MANDLKPSTEQPDEEHTHEIAGIRVGERNVPTSVIAVIVFIVFIALISWIPGQGF